MPGDGTAVQDLLRGVTGGSSAKSPVPYNGLRSRSNMDHPLQDAFYIRQEVARETLDCIEEQAWSLCSSIRDLRIDLMTCSPKSPRL